MRLRWMILRMLAVLFVGTVLCSSVGCSYLKHRYQDSLDMFDVGLTFSGKPGFAAYKACAGVTSMGYGNVKGRFIGLRGGRIGVLPFSHRSLGLGLWGRHKTWYAKTAGDTSTLGGLETAGAMGAVEDETEQVACVQQLHLGWAGIVFNINWVQIGDFLLGWTTADICSDDGKERGAPLPKIQTAPAPADTEGSGPILAPPLPRARR